MSENGNKNGNKNQVSLFDILAQNQKKKKQYKAK